MIGLNHVSGASLFRKMTAAVTTALVRGKSPVIPLPGLLRQICLYTEQHGNHFEYFTRVGRETAISRLGVDLDGQKTVYVPELGEALSLTLPNVLMHDMEAATSHLGNELLGAAGGDPSQERLAFIWYQPLAGATGRLTIAIRNVDFGTVV